MNQSIMDKRIARDIRRYGSPVYTGKMPVTIAGATWHLNVDTTWPASRRYKPLTTLEVVNNDVIDLEILVNGNTQLFVPHTSQKSWDDLPLYELAIKNVGALATTANAISISLYKPPIDADSIAREKNA